MADTKNLILYLNKDSLDLKRIAKKTGGESKAGCVLLKDSTIYHSGKVVFMGKSALDAFNKATALLSLIEKTLGKGSIRIIALGLTNRNNAARIFCPNLYLILEIVRREALEILDSFGVPAKLRDASAKLIAEEILNDIVFSNFVAFERYTVPSRKPIVSGWLVIDHQLKGKLITSYQEMILEGTIDIIPTRTSLLRKLRNLMSEHKREFVVAIISGLVAEAIIEVVIITLTAMPSLGTERTDASKVGRILKTNQRITSHELARLMKIPEFEAILELNSITLGGGAKVINHETREYEFLSDKLFVPQAYYVARSNDSFASSRVFQYHIPDQTVRKRSLKYLMKNEVLTRPKGLRRILEELRRTDLLVDKRVVSKLIKKLVPN